MKALIGILSVCSLLLSGGWTLHLLTLPVASAIEGEEGGDEGGDQGGQSETPAPAPAPASSEERSQNGARRGNETIRLQTMARFILTHLYGELLDADRERPALSLDATEQAFLCSMSRIRQYNASITPLWFPAYLAELINRPVAMVEQAMWSEACVR